MNDRINAKNLRNRVMGCWLGKAIGGTLGMPLEGTDGPHDVSFYSPVPTEMLPNDDLDLQVLWACILDNMETPRVDREVLANAWRDNVDFPWDEYGVAKRNISLGLRPPQTGSYDNWFAHGMGAAIRSEIWACLAPGDPDLAAKYAYEDACVDHAGEGIWAEVFFAALESAAFVESDPDLLLDRSLTPLPEDSLIRRAVSDTRLWWRNNGDWRAVRDLILCDYGHENFTDVTMNVAFTVLGWLAGRGDFSESICIAVNCGKDTDCTGATVGALMGILHPDQIPDRWLEPIGRDLVVSPEITGISPPDTLNGFTDLVIRLRDRLTGPLLPSQVMTASILPIEVDIAYVHDIPPSGPLALPNVAWTQITFEGTIGSLDRDKFLDEVLFLKYRISLPEARRVRIMFNTRTASRIWVDGGFAFGRDGGLMAPSFHRVPKGQYADKYLTAGKHEVIAAVERPERGTAEWVIGLGDAVTHQWIVGAV